MNQSSTAFNFNKTINKETFENLGIDSIPNKNNKDKKICFPSSLTKEFLESFQISYSTPKNLNQYLRNNQNLNDTKFLILSSNKKKDSIEILMNSITNYIKEMNYISNVENLNSNDKLLQKESFNKKKVINDINLIKETSSFETSNKNTNLKTFSSSNKDWKSPSREETITEEEDDDIIIDITNHDNTLTQSNTDSIPSMYQFQKHCSNVSESENSQSIQNDKVDGKIFKFFDSNELEQDLLSERNLKNKIISNIVINKDSKLSLSKAQSEISDKNEIFLTNLNIKKENSHNQLNHVSDFSTFSEKKILISSFCKSNSNLLNESKFINFC